MTHFQNRIKEAKRRLLEKDFISQQLKSFNLTILENNLTEEALNEFIEVKKAKPEFAKKVEDVIVKAAQGEALKERIDINKLKSILQAATMGDFTI